MQEREGSPSLEETDRSGSKAPTELRSVLRRHPFQVMSALVLLIGAFRMLWVARGNYDTLAVLLETTSLTTLGAGLVLTFFWLVTTLAFLYPLTLRRLRDIIEAGRALPALVYLGLFLTLALLFGFAAGRDSSLLDRQSQPLTGFLWLGMIIGLQAGAVAAGLGGAVFATIRIRQRRAGDATRTSAFLGLAVLNSSVALAALALYLVVPFGHFLDLLDRPLAPPTALTLDDGSTHRGYVLEDSGEWLTFMDCDDHFVAWIRLSEVRERQLIWSCE